MSELLEQVLSLSEKAALVLGIKVNNRDAEIKLLKDSSPAELKQWEKHFCELVDTGRWAAKNRIRCLGKANTTQERCKSRAQPGDLFCGRHADTYLSTVDARKVEPGLRYCMAELANPSPRVPYSYCKIPIIGRDFCGIHEARKEG